MLRPTLLAVALCSFSNVQFADELPTYEGAGGCYYMIAPNWPACTASQPSCSATPGVPVQDGVDYEFVNNKWWKIPHFKYTCPSSAKGVMDVNGLPGQVCYGRRNTMGKLQQTPGPYVCYRLTTCDEFASSSNEDHESVSGPVYEFIPDPCETYFFEPANTTGYWATSSMTRKAKKSNCTGDANHPGQAFPNVPIALGCIGDDC